MEKVHVGFELAEIDLKMRGSGEIFGLKQSGFVNFKIADITDHALVVNAQTEAKNILKADPSLRDHALLSRKIETIQEQYSQPN
jgi:ATP-dependent DNA helicase RecG